MLIFTDDVINVYEEDEGRLWWSNWWGWGGKEGATQFTREEIANSDLITLGATGVEL